MLFRDLEFIVVYLIKCINIVFYNYHKFDILIVVLHLYSLNGALIIDEIAVLSNSTFVAGDTPILALKSKF